MKTILYLFALVLVCSQAVKFTHTKDNLPGGWIVQDPQQFMKEPKNQDILENAKQQFIVQAQQANEISETKLTVQTVKSVATQVVSGINIQFNVDLVDENGKVYDVTLTVWTQPWRNSVTLTEHTIN